MDSRGGGGVGVDADPRSQFFTVQIRQDEFRVTYEPAPIPSEAAWMFHVLLTLLAVVGFEGDDTPSGAAEVPAWDAPTEGHVHAQAVFFLSGALQLYIDSLGQEDAVVAGLSRLQRASLGVQKLRIPQPAYGLPSHPGGRLHQRHLRAKSRHR